MNDVELQNCQDPAVLDERTDADVRRVLAGCPPLPMPDAVWSKIQVALADEQAQREAALSAHTSPVMAELDKDVAPQSAPSTTLL